MKRTRIFTLVMAIIWTIVGIAAIFLAASSNMSTAMNLLLVVLVVVAVVGNWMRYIRHK